MKRKNFGKLPAVLVAVAGFVAGGGVLANLIGYSARAEDTVDASDKVTLSILPSCGFMTRGGASADGQTFTGTGVNGAEVEFNDGGVRNFNIACNRSIGYSVLAYATSLDSETGNSIGFVNSGSYTATGGVGQWTALVGDAVAGDAASEVAYGSSAATALVIKRTNGPSGLEGDNIKITYKAYVAPTTPSGTYVGHASYMLAMNVDAEAATATAYTVSYNANGGTGAPADQSGTAPYVKISGSVPTRDGYEFLGWSTDETALAPEFMPGATIAITSSSHNHQLYAVWSMETMQGFRASSLAAGASVDLVDARDGKMYTVKKLADGKVWMMQDLDLDLYVENNNDTTALVAATGRMGTKGKSGNFVPFTNANTDLSGDSWTVSGSNVAYNTQKGSAQTGTSYKWDAYGRNASDNATYEVRSYDENTNTCIAPYETKTSDSNNTESNGHTSECDNGIGTANTQRIGNYYNWPAATAGTGNYLLDGDGDIATDSICPKGWHIPTGLGNYNESTYTYDSTEFNDMLYAEGISDIQRDDLGYQSYTLMTNEIMQRLTGFTGATAVNPTASRLSFLRSGAYNYSNGTVRIRGSYGLYWSSTANGSANAYNLTFYASYLYPGTLTINKGNGRAIRCVAV